MIVGDESKTCRKIAGLGETHQRTGEDELLEVSRMAGSPSDDGPHADARDNDWLPAKAVAQETGDRTEDSINPKEDCAQKPQLHVAELEVRFQQREDRKDDLPIDIVQQRNDP